MIRDFNLEGQTMAYRYGNREQVSFLPASIEEYVGQDDVVRVYDTFVDALDLSELGIDINDDHVGNPEYDPRSMLKLLVYGYAYGHRSSRKLERAVYHNLTYIWLMGGLRPDHKTIARFRRDHQASLRKVLKQCARICMKLGMISGNTLFVDGTKMQGNCSLAHTWTKEKCEDTLQRVGQRIEQILAECEETDRQESDESLVKMREELSDKKRLRAEVCQAMQELACEERNSLNMVDRESALLKPYQGRSVSGYNVQVVVDKDNGLIVNTDAVTDSNDLQQLSNQIKQAQDVVGGACKTAVADAGYHSAKQLKQVEESGITVVVPSPQEASKKQSDPNRRAGFIYDKERDCYICPVGHTATFRRRKEPKGFRMYKVNGSICKACERFGVCTKSREGRVVNRHCDTDAMERFARQYRDNRRIFFLRKQKSELPFGHFRRNLAFQSFLIRGIEGAKAEIALLANGFNITRMVNMVGAKRLVNCLSTM